MNKIYKRKFVKKNKKKKSKKKLTNKNKKSYRRYRKNRKTKRKLKGGMGQLYSRPSQPMNTQSSQPMNTTDSDDMTIPNHQSVAFLHNSSDGIIDLDVDSDIDAKKDNTYEFNVQSIRVAREGSCLNVCPEQDRDVRKILENEILTINNNLDIEGQVDLYTLRRLVSNLSKVGSSDTTLKKIRYKEPQSLERFSSIIANRNPPLYEVGNNIPPGEKYLDHKSFGNIDTDNSQCMISVKNPHNETITLIYYQDGQKKIKTLYGDYRGDNTVFRNIYDVRLSDVYEKIKKLQSEDKLPQFSQVIHFDFSCSGYHKDHKLFKQRKKLTKELIKNPDLPSNIFDDIDKKTLERTYSGEETPAQRSARSQDTFTYTLDNKNSKSLFFSNDSLIQNKPIKKNRKKK